MKTLANRTLHWLAAVGVFLLFDAVGVQQLAANYLEKVNYEMRIQK